MVTNPPFPIDRESISKEVEAYLRIMHIQPRPCCRAVKLAHAERAIGHHTFMGSFADPEQKYPDFGREAFDIWIPVGFTAPGRQLNCQCTPHALFNLLNQDYVNVVHSHNTPNWFTNFLVQENRTKIPVVHNNHDVMAFMTEYQNKPEVRREEINSLSLADGNVFVSERQWKDTEEEYKITMDPETVLVWPCYASWEMRPRVQLPKWSEKDGEVHLAYQGGISMKKDQYAHRYYWPFFQNMVDQNIHVHVFEGVGFPENTPVPLKSEYLHWHKCVPVRNLMLEMTQADGAIAGFNGYNQFDLNSFDAGLLDHSIGDLPVFTAGDFDTLDLNIISVRMYRAIN